MRFSAPTRIWLAGYLLVAALVVVSEVLPWPPGGFLGLVLAMPALAGVLLSAGWQRVRWGRRLLVGLVFSWLGDLLGWVIVIKIGFFLIAQIAYLVAFWPYRLRIRRLGLVIAGYAAAVAVAIAVLGRSTGSLLPAVVVYAMALGSMAILAHGVGRLAALGGTIFFGSDFLIGVDAFLPAVPVPAAGALIMISYLSAQLLLLVGAGSVLPSTPAPGSDRPVRPAAGAGRPSDRRSRSSGPPSER